MQRCVASLVSIALQISRAWWVLALIFLAMLVGAGSLPAHAQDDPGPRSIFSEVRLGLFGHHVEPAGLAADELREGELLAFDEAYPVCVAIRAVKGGAG